MFCRLSFFLALASLAWSVPHFEYRAIGLRDNNGTSSPPSTTRTGTMAMTTETNVFNLSSYCAAQSSNFRATYDSKGKLTTTTHTYYSGIDDTGDQTGSIVSQKYFTATITYTREAYEAYQDGGAKPPCCNTCQMSAGTIQFYWWPDLASSTAVQPTSTGGSNAIVTEVAPNGFIFTSPSVYMAFSSLYAHNYCGTVGDVWYNTTIGFHPDEIKTINDYTTTYTSVRLTTEEGTTETEIVTWRGTRPPPSPLTYKDLAQNCSSIPGYVYFPDDPQNSGKGNDPCHPLLALPDSLIKRQQVWADNNCQAVDGYGAYDPPQALTAAEAEAKPTLPVPAQPGSTGFPSNAPVTTTFTAQPDTRPTSSVDSNSNAQPPEPTYVLGGGSSSSTNIQFPSSVVASSESGLDSASRSDGPTLNSPDSQPSASELDTPTQPSNVVAVTSDDVGQETSNPKADRPQPETSQTSVVAPGGNDSPEDDQTYTLVQPTRAGSDQAPVDTYTYTQETTMANGQVSTMLSTSIIVPAGVDAAPSLTIGNNVLSANSAGEYVVSPDATLSMDGPSVTVDNTAYALKTNSAGETMLVAGAAAASTSSVDMGDYIMIAIGSNRTSSSTSTSQTTGSATSETIATYTGDAVAVRSVPTLMLCLFTMTCAMI